MIYTFTEKKPEWSGLFRFLFFKVISDEKIFFKQYFLEKNHLTAIRIRLHQKFHQCFLRV